LRFSRTKKVMPTMQIRNRVRELRRVKAADLVPNPKNWRTHPKGQQDALRGILAEVGYADALLARELPDGSLMLVDGHLRAETTPEQEVPVLVLDISEAEADKLLLSLDPLAALAETNAVALDALLREVDTGSEGLQQMYADLADAAELYQDDAKEIVEDEIPEPPIDPITKPGDLWLLGEHRVMCGDSTKAEDVGRLMAGAKASLVFTDPPYGMSFQSNFRTATPQFEKIENDDTILVDWIPHAIANSNGWVFVWTTWKVLDRWLPSVLPFGKLSNMVVWHKPGGSMGDLIHTFGTDYELALVFSRGAELCGKRIGSVWSFNKDAAATYVHPTQKPVALAAEAIEKTTPAKALVMDLFCGSGTTLIAAEQLGRKCYGMEISPAYCDVVVKRWETLTGKKATLEVNDGQARPATGADHHQDGEGQPRQKAAQQKRAKAAKR
jgi:DNA modification methylase